MGTIAGIFNATKEAERAFSELQTEAGFPQEDVVLLAPGSSAKELDAVPTDEGEQPGMGSAIGGVVGGAVGLIGCRGVWNRRRGGWRGHRWRA